MCDRVIPIPDEIKQEFSLDQFYHNYTNAYGIPILSSGAVPLAAMQRACYTVRFMLADRDDVRNAMHNKCARVSIIGLNELTNQIPEYSFLPDSENERARGIGGTLNNPVTTVAEENLLCLDYEHDRWFREDIGVHEFAHAIHKIGMNTVDSGFSKRLRNAKNAAISMGLWESTYAASNAQEYYAEGVQKFFGVDVIQEYTDGVHNNISNRIELLEYDPQLYSFVLETFPCANHIVSRCEDQALISTQPLMMNCYSEMMETMATAEKEFTAEVATENGEPSANVVSTIISTMRTEPKTPTEAETSTENGGPSTNVISTIISTMRTEPNTPTVTDTLCLDQYSLCNIYATESMCRNYPIIQRLCRFSCHLCNVCSNFNSQCELWYEEGICEIYPGSMMANCKKACRWC
ncbi:uncharacterized protein LOC117123408 isoform X2 [Anneissia japonica]|nr:uncharacterized protein LOC117123408 isoform X2 [Anneissia japonica]